jgi:hypothetical protein
MLVCCSVISVIVILALLGGVILLIIQAIIAKISRTAWAKTLVDMPIGRLEAELSFLVKKKGSLLNGFLGMSKGQQQDVTSKIGDVEARIKILERLISERQSVKSDKSD